MKDDEILRMCAALPKHTIPYHEPHAIAFFRAGMREADRDLLAACRAVAGVFQDSEDKPLYAQKCIAAIARIAGDKP